MASFIENEINKKKLNELDRYDNEINKLIVQLMKTSNMSQKIEIKTKINKLKRDKTYYQFKNYIKKFLANILILGLFTFNFIAVGVSMSCSKGRPIYFRILSALYAFFFSILYILINYRYYRLGQKKDTTTCNICPNNPFGL